MVNNFFNSKTSTLSPVLTSYDFLKTAAIVLMVIDHIGYFFYPEDLWLRAVGRMSAPIWFFLIGYAKSRDLSPRMWIAACVMIAWNFVTGFSQLPLGIIATMIVMRLILDPLMSAIARKPSSLYPIVAILFVIAFPSSIVLEYGTPAMLIVMVGYMTRNRESLPWNKNDYATYCMVAAACYLLYQVQVFFPFDTPQKILVGAGIMGVMLLLMNFRPFSYPELTAKMPAIVSGFFRLCGRRSLEIYVLHLIAFKIIVLMHSHATHDYFSFHILI